MISTEPYQRPIVAITGATGFIGSTLTQLLRESGWRVRILVRPATRLSLAQRFSVDCIEGSLENFNSLRRLVDGVFAVIHCAGAVRGASLSQFEQVNVIGVAQVVKAISQHKKPPRLLLLSSLAARHPEISNYAASKYHGEKVLVEQAENIIWSVFRPPAVYGPGDRELIPLFRLMGRGIAPMLGPPDAQFSLLHVNDLACAVQQWLKQDKCVKGVFELHDGRVNGYSWNLVVNTIEKIIALPIRRFRVPRFALYVPAAVNGILGTLLPYAPMLTPGKLRELNHPNWLCDNTAITKSLGWTPKTDFDTGLRELRIWKSTV